MTEQTNAAALLAVMNAALPTKVRAFDLDKVPPTRPDWYVEMSLSRMFGGNPRVSGRYYTTGYRVSIGAISKFSIEDVRASLATCTSVLEGNRLTVGEQKSTPIQFETEDAPEPDNGAFSGYRVFTYVIRD